MATPEEAAMDGVCVYVVYHEKLYPENFEGYDAADRARWFRLFATNEPRRGPKDDGDAWGGPPTVREWELPWHDPLQQMNGYYNNSALWHVWRNAEALPKTEFVGFAQYDMAIPRDSLEGFAALTGHRDRVGYMFPDHGWQKFLKHSALPASFWADMLAGLGLGDELTLEQLVAGRPVPIMHGLVMRRTEFDRMMQWLDGQMGRIIRALGHDTQHLAGTLERAIGLWVAARVHAGKLGPAVHLKGCVHADEQRLPDPLRPYTVAGDDDAFSRHVLPYSDENVFKGTDKLTTHSYGPLYDALFGACDRAAPLRILEIGVCSGGFLRALADYFPNASLTGVDISTQFVRQDWVSHPNVRVLCADALDPDLSLPHEEFDIIIDDASHTPESQVLVTKMYGSKLRPGGMLVVEDVSDSSVVQGIRQAAEAHGLDVQCHDLRTTKCRFDDMVVVCRRRRSVTA